MKIITITFLITLSLNSFAQTEYDKLIREGLQLLIQQNVPAAIKKYEAAYKIDSTKVEANYGLGIAYLVNCKSKGSSCFTSLSYLNIAIEIDSTYRNGYHNRGVCRNLVKDFNGALKDYNLAINKKPYIASYYVGRALIHKKIGNKKEACKDLHKAVNLNSIDAKELLITQNCN